MYLKKSEENWELAEYAVQHAKFNGAVSSFYYSLYLQAKSLLIERDFDYISFVRDVLHMKDWKHKRHLYSHGTICRALTRCLSLGDNENDHNFAEYWDNMFRYRIKADYSHEAIERHEALDCMETFYYLKEVMTNEQS